MPPEHSVWIQAISLGFLNQEGVLQVFHVSIQEAAE